MEDPERGNGLAPRYTIHLFPAKKETMGITQKILDFAKIAEKTIHVPEWDVTILVKGLTVQQVGDLQKQAKGDGDLLAVLMIIASVHDPETGQRVFEPAHRDSLLNSSNGVVAALVREVSEMSALTPESLKAAEKN